MSAADRERIAADWAARGYSCAVWTDPPGQRWEDFRHAEEELVTVPEGDMEFEVAGRVHRPHGALSRTTNSGSTTPCRTPGSWSRCWCRTRARRWRRTR
jgi:hypothetical protein